jgi:hypothetical protein
MSYGPALLTIIGAPRHVDKILKAQCPAIFRRQPTKFELVINLKTAKALRLRFGRCWRAGLVIR